MQENTNNLIEEKADIENYAKEQSQKLGVATEIIKGFSEILKKHGISPNISQNSLIKPQK